jgi:hypothetical protein
MACPQPDVTRPNFVFTKREIADAGSSSVIERDYQMARRSKRQAWSASDVRTLKTLARSKTGAATIARKMKRTEGASRQKAFSMGLSLDTRA